MNLFDITENSKSRMFEINLFKCCISSIKNFIKFIDIQSFKKYYIILLQISTTTIAVKAQATTLSCQRVHRPSLRLK